MTTWEHWKSELYPKRPCLKWMSILYGTPSKYLQSEEEMCDEKDNDCNEPEVHKFYMNLGRWYKTVYFFQDTYGSGKGSYLQEKPQVVAVNRESYDRGDRPPKGSPYCGKGETKTINIFFWRDEYMVLLTPEKAEELCLRGRDV